MNQQDPIDQFIAYVAKRGIPERYHELYRKELLSILLLSGAKSLTELDAVALGDAVREAEHKLKNRRAVCVAIERFLQRELREAKGQVDASAAGDEMPESFDWKTSGAVHQPGSQYRKYVRVPFHGSVSVDGMPTTDHASDLSLGGIYIETMKHFEVGTSVTVSFKLEPEDDSALTLLATVVYSDPGIGAGLDFVSLPKEVRARIRRFIESAVQSQS